MSSSADHTTPAGSFSAVAALPPLSDTMTGAQADGSAGSNGSTTAAAVPTASTASFSAASSSTPLLSNDALPRLRPLDVTEAASEVPAPAQLSNAAERSKEFGLKNRKAQRDSLASPQPVALSSPTFSRHPCSALPSLGGKLSESWVGTTQLRRLFQLLDRDNNGTISLGELQTGLRSLGFSAEEIAQLQSAQQALDEKHTGVIRSSQFMRAFRTLNRRAIEEKLKLAAVQPSTPLAAGAVSPSFSVASAAPSPECRIQLFKIGHTHDPIDGIVQTDVRHAPNIEPHELGEYLRKEEETVAAAAAAASSSALDQAITWLDICGLHPGVLALLSNFYLLPHEMLSYELLAGMDNVAHADFYTGRPNPFSSAVHHYAKSVKRRAHQSANQAAGTNTQTSGNAGNAAAAATAAPAQHQQSGDSSSSTSSSSASASPASSPQPSPSEEDLSHSTLKILIHTMQLVNYPLQLHPSKDDIDLVSQKQYRAARPALEKTPIHLIIANQHTLITIRPWPGAQQEAQEQKQRRRNSIFGGLRGKSGSAPMTPFAGAGAGANAEGVGLARRSRRGSKDASQSQPSTRHNSKSSREDEDDAEQEEEEEEDDATFAGADLFHTFIRSFLAADQTSFGSPFGLTSAKLLCVRLLEHLCDSNWAVRDQLKEWKIRLGDALIENSISREYFVLQVNDMERLATGVVRVLKPMLAAVASLAGAAMSAGEAPTAATNPAANAFIDTGYGGSTASSLPSASLIHPQAAAQNPSATGGLSSLLYDPGLGVNSTSLTSRYFSEALRDNASWHARAVYLKEIASSLRILHRTLARQLDQALLSVSLTSQLQSQYSQRIRDRTDGTLYLLTVVTTIVTPLQIFASVYGMNFEWLPELKLDHAYLWFWIINIIVIILIGIWFRVKELL